MSTKERVFSQKFKLTEHKGKYGIIDINENVILYPVYDSICELDSYDFIVEQNGKLGYAYFNEQGDKELLLPLYDVIIKKKHGLSLERRSKDTKEYFWYDTKSHTLYSGTRHIRSFKEHDLLISTRQCDYLKPPYLKKWGQDALIKIPSNISLDILYEIPFGEFSAFVAIEECENNEYKYCFLIVKKDGYFTISSLKENIEDLYKIMEDIKCNSNIIWLLPKQK